ncbi:phage portal protein [Parafrankia discariae]|uniref:phage portal protein n=1 Tax=Parafrankia discariae TaxID=365528 RepID=UPI0018A7F1A6|nr:phage portal protein [Parafrankia discariae]
MSDLSEAVAAIREARPAYEEALAYYEGKVGEVFASRAVAHRLRKSAPQYRLNLARRPVAAVLDRLTLAAVSAEPDAAGTWLEEQWARNTMGLDALDVHEAACVFGDAYVIVWPGEVEGDVDIFFNSPLTTRVFYDAENPRVRRYAAKIWPEGERLRANLYYPDRVERYVSKKGTTDGTGAGDFEPYIDPDDEGAAWPEKHEAGEVPVYHFRTRRPYGRPVHADAYGPQNAITKLVVTQMETADYQAFPQRYALLNAATDDLGADYDDDEEDDGVTGEGGGGLSNLRAGAGELWQLRNVTSVGQFTAGSVAAALDPIAFYIRALGFVTGTPVHQFEPRGDAPSGQSVRAMDMPLTRSVERLQDSFGVTWTQVVAGTLRTGGQSGAAPALRWEPAATVDDLEGWKTISEKIGAGVPVRQALLEAGYTTEQVDGWLSGVTDDDLRRHIEILALFGDAIQKLGAGAALGVADTDQIAGLVSHVIARQQAGDAEQAGTGG